LTTTTTSNATAEGAPETITLHNTIPPANKCYILALVAAAVSGLWNVLYSNGRIGATLTTPKPKNPQPLPYAAAKKLFDKIVREKKSEGYRDVEAGEGSSSPVSAADARQTGVGCQLLNKVDEARVEELIADDAFGAQKKFDGHRVLIQSAGGEIVGINRRGLTRGLPETILAGARELASLYGDFILDGEAVGDDYFAFDLLACGGTDLRDRPYKERFRSLAARVLNLDHIELAELAEGRAAKAELLARLRRENEEAEAGFKQKKVEGIVFKRLDAPYRAGRPNSGGDQLKHKFWETCSVIVVAVNQKRSVAVSVLDAAGARVGVGNVTVPANKSIPAVGSVVEVRYLYAFKGGSLFHTTYLDERDDITVEECVIEQLKFKPEAGAGADEEDEEDAERLAA
jgi:bifunctional non-homologous end joining protein LigD